MADTQATQESQILRSFLVDLGKKLDAVFRGGKTPFAIDRFGRKVEQTERPELADLNFDHPVYGLISKQIDAATVLVRDVETHLNRQETFCVPIHVDLGKLKATYDNYDRDADYVKYGYHRPDLNTEYSLAILRSNDSWRIAIYRWTVFGASSGGRSKLSEPICKPWLESSYFDKVVTISHLSTLVEKLLTQVQLMVHIAESNPSALSKLGDVVESLPNRDQSG